MPLIPGKENIGRNIGEFSMGPTFARTARKFGSARAKKQAIAVALKEADVGRDQEQPRYRKIGRAPVVRLGMA